jgi:glycosyltransferase involved in cell wall biosynthesis
MVPLRGKCGQIAAGITHSVDLQVPMKNAPLRIAQVAPLWTPIPPVNYGGIELLMKLLVDDLVDRGHEVTLFASADCQTRGKLHPVCEKNLTDLTSAGEAYCYEYYTNSLFAEVLQNARHFDLIHFHLSTAWLPMASASPTQTLFTLHTNLICDDLWAFKRWPEIPVNGISRNQIAPAQTQLARQFPVVHNGCDFDAYSPNLKLETAQPRLAFLGRMSPQKNPLGAIQIAKAAGLPIDLAGQPQNASEQRYFAEQIQPLLDGSSVRWIGPVDHAAKNLLLRNSAALIFPIQWDEPFGLVMIEAMACGTPVVALQRGSVPEVVDPGLTGFHAPTIEEMPALVGRALQLDRSTIRTHAESRFAYRRMVDSYVELYRSLLSPNPAPPTLPVHGPRRPIVQ